MQSTSYFNAPKFSVAPIAYDRDTDAAFMQYLANLTRLKQLDRVAYDAIIAREYIKKGGAWVAGESWQALDVDVCHELDRLVCLSEQDEITGLRAGM